MRSSRSARVPLLAALGCAAIGCAALVGGCQVPAERERVPALDACAERLHEISGRLLLYYSTHRRLPASLEALPALRGAGAEPPRVCPVSGKAYLYRPEGLALPGGGGRLVVCDAAPSHSGGRWAIVLSREAPSAPLAARVVWLPETRMRSILDTANREDSPETDQD